MMAVEELDGEGKDMEVERLLIDQQEMETAKMTADEMEEGRLEMETAKMKADEMEEGRLEMKMEKLEGVKTKMDPEEATVKKEEKTNLEYKKILSLEELELVPNADDVICPICFVDVAANEGITLRDCLHSFCCSCLVSTIQYSEEAEIRCPYRDNEYACDSILQDREVRALVPEEVKDQLLARSVALAEKRMGAEAFHCKTPDCQGWCVLDGNINEFPCPVCNRINCLKCKEIHEGVDCWQYQVSINGYSEEVGGQMTKEALNTHSGATVCTEMIMQGVAMYCPSCSAVIMKDMGCDWVLCSMCRLEICWVTRGHRWGPGGRGDENGGCRCKVNGKKCHPLCRNCH